MKKLSTLILCLFLCFGLFAKQYLYTITVSVKSISVTSSVNVKNDLEKALFDLILRG